MSRSAKEKMLIINDFAGLVNKKDTTRRNKSGGNQIGEAAMSVATNAYIDDDGKIEKAEGFTSVESSNISDAFATTDESKFYVIVNGVLNDVDLSFTLNPIFTFAGSTSDHAQWQEFNEEVYVVFAGEGVIISRDGSVRTWGVTVPTTPLVETTGGTLPAGQYQVALAFLDPRTGRESGSSALVVHDLTTLGALRITVPAPPTGYVVAVYVTTTDGDVLYRAVFAESSTTLTWNGPQSRLSYPLRTQHFEPFPSGSAGPTAAFRGSCYVSSYHRDLDQSVVYASEPLSWEHFDLLNGAMHVKGRVTMLLGVAEALIIGTDEEIFSYDGTALSRLADYGVVPGSLGKVMDGKGMFWTKEGLCKALPFENVHMETVSVAPGTSGSDVVVDMDGISRYIACVTTGGVADNPSNS